MRISDLYSDPKGNFSSSKLWTTLAYIVSTVIVCINYDKFDWTMLLAYTGAIGGSEIAKKWISVNAPKHTTTDDSAG